MVKKIILSKSCYFGLRSPLSRKEMKTAMTMIDFENDAIHVLDKILVYRYFKWSLFHTNLMHKSSY